MRSSTWTSNDLTTEFPLAVGESYELSHDLDGGSANQKDMLD